MAAESDAALERLIRDWQTIWCSELQALASDGEAHDALAAAVAAFRTSFDSAAAPAAGTDAPTRPAAAAAAPDARDAAILRLGIRVTRLERMLAERRRDDWPGGS